MKASNLVGLGVLGFGGYYLAKQMGWFSAGGPFTGVTGSSSTTATAGTSTAAQAPVLTAADAATFPYSGSVTPDQMNAIGATINQQIAAGQIPSIAGGSVLAYMLGWGGLPAGTSKTASLETYTFDGSNWILQPQKVQHRPINNQLCPDGSLYRPGATMADWCPTAAATQLQKLSYALNLWAVSHGNAQQMNMSQWNYILNSINKGGAPPVMTDPYSGGIMTADQYVSALKGDPSYASNLPSISQNFGLAAYRPRTMSRAYRFNYVVKPRFA